MQYGNTKMNEVIADKEMFKSYYVVWKRVGDILTPNVFAGLNRTMQYGNSLM